MRVAVVMCTAGNSFKATLPLLMLAPFSLKSAHECGVGPVLMVKRQRRSFLEQTGLEEVVRSR